jgi:hypothetical protein
MPYSLLADAVLVVHALFIAFVVAGALLVVRWGWLVWLHLPCAAWGAWIEFSGGICPLTPVEQKLRRRAGEAGYEGGFIETYVTSFLYPEGLTRTHQVILGAGVVVLNLALYAWVMARRRRGRDPRASAPRRTEER